MVMLIRETYALRGCREGRLLLHGNVDKGGLCSKGMTLREVVAERQCRLRIFLL